MYEDFVKQFASIQRPMAYGNWQLAQAYQGAGDLQKALDYGDKAQASAPAVSIFSSLRPVSRSSEEQPQAADYSVRGGEVYNPTPGKTKPEGVSDQDFATHTEEQMTSAKVHTNFEAAAYK